MNVSKRPERLRSSTRMVLILFTLATIFLTFTGKISGEQFLVAQASVFGFFFGTRRKDGTNPEAEDSKDV